MPANKPNGTVTVFYGTAASCQKHLLDKQDWVEAQKRPDAAMWSTSAQSGTVIDMQAATIKNGCYRGYE
jgi:hypothetical protein